MSSAIDKVLDNLELNKPVREESTGRWFTTGVAARAGVQDYTSEFGKHIYRDSKLIKAMVEELKYKNLTMGHFEQNPNENRDKRAGFIVDSVYQNGLAIVRLCIDHPYLCKLLDERAEGSSVQDVHLGLSVGYKALIKDEEGVWKDRLGIGGTKGKSYSYQGQQTLPVSVNHLAVVPMGRGGEVVKMVLDEDISPSSNNLHYFEDKAEMVSHFDNGGESVRDSTTTKKDLEENSELSDGGALYPYPSRKGYTHMKQEDMAGMYEDMKRMMDKITSTCDSMTKAHDAMNAKIEKSCSDMASYADNLTNSLNYLQAIKQAFEEQDRGAGSGTVRSDTPDMIADEDTSAKFNDAVKDAVALWVEFSDQLKEQVTDFSLSAADLQRELLKLAQVDISDEASELEVTAAFNAYRALQKQMPSKEASPSAVEQVFNRFKDAAPAPNGTEGYTRSANGTLTFE